MIETLCVTLPVMVFGLFLYLRLYKRMNLENEALRRELHEMKYTLEERTLPAMQEAAALRDTLEHVVQWLKDHIEQDHAEPLDPATAVRSAREARRRQREIEEALSG